MHFLMHYARCAAYSAPKETEELFVKLKNFLSAPKGLLHQDREEVNRNATQTVTKGAGIRVETSSEPRAESGRFCSPKALSTPERRQPPLTG